MDCVLCSEPLSEVASVTNELQKNIPMAMGFLRHPLAQHQLGSQQGVNRGSPGALGHFSLPFYQRNEKLWLVCVFWSSQQHLLLLSAAMGQAILKENHALFGSGILEWLRWLLYFRVPHGQQPRLGLQPSEVRGLSGAGFLAELAHMVIGWDSVF